MDADEKILAGAVKAIITVVLGNGNNTVVGHAFVDGQFYRVEIKITEVTEGNDG